VLRDLVPRLRCASCRRGDADLGLHEFMSGSEGHVRDGVLRCFACAALFPIEDGLLELVPASLLDPEQTRAFAEKFADGLAGLGGRAALGGGHGGDEVDDLLVQRELFDRYAEGGDEYVDYTASPFWRAVDGLICERWKREVGSDGWLLEMGSASGRASFTWTDRFTVVGFDISKKMIRRAIERSRASGVEGRTTFFVGDGCNPPLKDQSFDYVQTYGVLHHLRDLAASTRDIQCILRSGGTHLGCENNLTVFRPLFDLLMRILPLWVEEAGEKRLISGAMLEDWTSGAPARVNAWTSVFVPPHLCNWIGRTLARQLLAITDAVACTIPGLRNQGGLIFFEIEKG
jgi:SAM-dependent methyltransferase